MVLQNSNPRGGLRPKKPMIALSFKLDYCKTPHSVLFHKIVSIHCLWKASTTFLVFSKIPMVHYKVEQGGWVGRRRLLGVSRLPRNLSPSSHIRPLPLSLGRRGVHRLPRNLPASAYQTCLHDCRKARYSWDVKNTLGSQEFVQDAL